MDSAKYVTQHKRIYIYKYRVKKKVRVDKHGLGLENYGLVIETVVSN